jgi:hypothetical protein
MKMIIFLVIFAASFSTVKAQIRYTGYLYSSEEGSKEKFEYSASTSVSDGAFKTIYKIFRPGSKKNRYTIIASHYKEQKKIVVEVNDEQYILSDMTGKEETTYEYPTMKPFGFRGNLGILDKSAPAQLAVQFLSAEGEYVRVLSFLGSSADGQFQFFLFNQSDNITVH